MDTKTKNVNARVLTLYSTLFFLVWTVRQMTLHPYMESIGMGDWPQAFIDALIKLAVWTLPAMLLIKRYEPDMFVPLKDMFKNRFRPVQLVLVAAAFLLYNLAASYIINGKIAFVDFNYTSLIGTVLFVGITEEIVFRGWLLNATIEKMKPGKAIALNAAMFLVIHFPGWIAKGTFINNIVSGGFLSIVVLSVVFSFAFIKSRNILVPIFLHMFWNLLVMVLVG